MRCFQSGLTLFELLICIAVLSVAFTLSSRTVPSWVNHAQITSSHNNLIAVIHYAKAHAIIEEISVTVCPLGTGGRCDGNHWGRNTVAFTDANNNGVLDKNEHVIRHADTSHKKIKIKASRDHIVFYAGGVTASPASVYLCLFDSPNHLSRGFTISLQGRVRSAQDRDKNGLHELHGNKEITCN